MANVLVIPDVHGRNYLLNVARKYAEQYPDRRIIFLGDYLDPYPYEWDIDPELEADAKDICKEDAFELFKQIINFAKCHPNNVTLLLGNHDCHYLGISDDHCRLDWIRRHQIFNLFNENKELFKFACKIDNTLFTHAGCTSEWLRWSNYKEDPITIVSQLNSDIVFDEGFLDMFKGGSIKDHRGDIGYSRGGDCPYGSCIWADLIETMYDSAFKDSLIQIFGHTQLQETGHFIHINNIYCIDSRCAFEWNGKDLTKYEN